MYQIIRVMGFPRIRVITCVVYQRCVLTFLLGACRDHACVDCEAYTVDGNSRFPVLIT